MRFPFVQNKALPLAALGWLEEAKSVIRIACQLAPIGSFNWHTAFIKRIVICFHSGDYQEAYILYKAHRHHQKPHKNAEVYWRVLYGYLYILIQAGKIESYGEERLSLAKFLNDVPTFTRDKAGNNINLIIIEIMVRMQRGQFGRIIDRMEALREYTRAYTRRPETKRANVFHHSSDECL